MFGAFAKIFQALTLILKSGITSLRYLAGDGENMIQKYNNLVFHDTHFCQIIRQI